MISNAVKFGIAGSIAAGAVVGAAMGSANEPRNGEDLRREEVPALLAATAMFGGIGMLFGGIGGMGTWGSTARGALIGAAMAGGMGFAANFVYRMSD